MICPRCNATDFETDRVKGTVCCTKCGHVASESHIVSEVNFIKTASGATGRSGTTVRSTSDHRALTIARAEDRLHAIASALQIPERDVESAKKLYLLALNSSFSSGRKLDDLLAICLYIICRRRNSPHLLIDFSEHLNTNIYKLGHLFFEFQKNFNISAPLFDPSLFIPRFLQSLSIQPQNSQKIILTATKIMKILKEEWIHLGRKPFSLIAASIYLSLLMNNNYRSKEEICSICRCEVSTLNERLFEMEKSVFCGLKISEIEKIDFEKIEKISGKGKNLPSFLARNDLNFSEKLTFSEKLLKKNEENLLKNSEKISSKIEISEFLKNRKNPETLKKFLIDENSAEFLNKKILWEERFQDFFEENELNNFEKNISEKKKILRKTKNFKKKEKKEIIGETAEKSVKKAINSKINTNFLEISQKNYEIEQEFEEENEMEYN